MIAGGRQLGLQRKPLPTSDVHGGIHSKGDQAQVLGESRQSPLQVREPEAKMQDLHLGKEHGPPSQLFQTTGRRSWQLLHRFIFGPESVTYYLPAETPSYYLH